MNVSDIKKLEKIILDQDTVIKEQKQEIKNLTNDKDDYESQLDDIEDQNFYADAIVKVIEHIFEINPIKIDSQSDGMCEKCKANINFNAKNCKNCISKLYETILNKIKLELNKLFEDFNYPLDTLHTYSTDKDFINLIISLNSTELYSNRHINDLVSLVKFERLRRLSGKIKEKNITSKDKIKDILDKDLQKFKNNLDNISTRKSIIIKTWDDLRQNQSNGNITDEIIANNLGIDSIAVQRMMEYKKLRNVQMHLLDWTSQKKVDKIRELRAKVDEEKEMDNNEKTWKLFILDKYESIVSISTGGQIRTINFIKMIKKKMKKKNCKCGTRLIKNRRKCAKCRK